MPFEAEDLRKRIRTAIGIDHIIDGQLEECIRVTDNLSANVYVPMYVREEESIDCPPFPYIVIDLLGIPAVPHDINAATRYHRCLISFDIKYDDMEDIDVTSFGKKIADQIVNSTRVSQCSETRIDFMNVHNQGRVHIENRCEEVVFHWIMELEAWYYGAHP
jgi:hypothetical protein